MNRKLFAYVRLNKKSENLDDQVSAIQNYCNTNGLNIQERDIVKDDEDIHKNSGYKALSDYMMRQGDVLIINELNRIGRDVSDIYIEWKRLFDSGIDIIIVNNEKLTTYGKDDIHKQIINDTAIELLKYLSEIDKERKRRRQLEGIQALKDKNNGKGIGRPKTKINKEFINQYKLWKAGKQTAVCTFKNLGLTKATFYRLAKEYEENQL